jgi:hypothetical protein
LISMQSSSRYYFRCGFWCVQNMQCERRKCHLTDSKTRDFTKSHYRPMLNIQTNHLLFTHNGSDSVTFLDAGTFIIQPFWLFCQSTLLCFFIWLFFLNNLNYDVPMLYCFIHCTLIINQLLKYFASEHHSYILRAKIQVQ